MGIGKVARQLYSQIIYGPYGPTTRQPLSEQFSNYSTDLVGPGCLESLLY
jgi:hypothetical protein